ncbi:MAG: prepilin-type N-terminal cleavage/methylation domain-containing protein, partial [Candidatus Brennerbacteria bacterium]|nr:prepilin-type N-terminal cleavage/methylation domain-containing protein [Candidatus Brennerbacteria bacterium]
MKKLKLFKNLYEYLLFFAAEVFKIIEGLINPLNSKSYILNSRNNGQALVEILVGLSIGAILIGVLTGAVAVALKSNVQIKNFQAASSFAQELVDEIRIVSEAKWNDIYNLSPKGTSTNYFIIASGTNLAVIPGKEGVLGDNVSKGLVGYWKFD